MRIFGFLILCLLVSLIAACTPDPSWPKLEADEDGSVTLTKREKGEDPTHDQAYTSIKCRNRKTGEVYNVVSQGNKCPKCTKRGGVRDKQIRSCKLSWP